MFKANSLARKWIAPSIVKGHKTVPMVMVCQKFCAFVFETITNRIGECFQNSLKYN